MEGVPELPQDPGGQDTQTPLLNGGGSSIHLGGADGVVSFRRESHAPRSNSAEPFPGDPWEDASGESEPDVNYDSEPSSPRPTHNLFRVWGNWGEYTLDPKWRTWVLKRLGVPDIPILVDLFAEPWSAAAPLYITKGMDALSFFWPSLQEGYSGILWGNPPFRMLNKVADKIAREPCWVALCTPEWVDEEWWRALLSVPHRRERLPARRKLFFGGFRKTALPQKKEWRTVVWLLDNRGQVFEEGSELKGIKELKEALAKISQVDWSHGYRGGKPMLPIATPPSVVDKATQCESQEPQEFEAVTSLSMDMHSMPIQKVQVTKPAEKGQESKEQVFGQTSVDAQAPVVPNRIERTDHPQSPEQSARAEVEVLVADNGETVRTLTQCSGSPASLAPGADQSQLVWAHHPSCSPETSGRMPQPAQKAPHSLLPSLLEISKPWEQQQQHGENEKQVPEICIGNHS